MPNTQYAKDTRNNMVQIFRAFAIIAVVLIHTTPGAYWQVFFRPFINFAVATFLFLSGYLTKIDNDNWGAFYKKRIIRILIPYVIWTVVYTIIFLDLSHLHKKLLTANASFHMYYLAVYIQFVLLTPIIGKLAKSKYMHLGWLVAPISIIVFNYYRLLSGQELNPTVSLIWSDAFLGWFTFYYLGLILGNRIIEKNYSLKMLTILYLASIVLQMGEGYGWLMLGGSDCGTQLKLSTLLTSSLFLLIIYTILRKGNIDIQNKYLRMIGDYSFGIYLCHVMVLFVIMPLFPFSRSFPFLITAVVVLLLSLCLCYLGHRILGEKVSRWLGLI